MTHAWAREVLTCTRLAIALLASCCLICTGYVPDVRAFAAEAPASAIDTGAADGQATADGATEDVVDASEFVSIPEDLDFASMDSDELLEYVSNTLYASVANSLGDEESAGLELIDAQATYQSHEYLEEMRYNSQANVFFGHTLDELNAEFEGSRYLFTLGDDGTTQVVPLEQDATTSYEHAFDDVEFGAGVVLLAVSFAIPVTSVASAGGAVATGASAMNVVRAIVSVGAKNPADVALTAATVGPDVAHMVTSAARGDAEGAALSATDAALSIVPVPGIGKCSAFVGKIGNGLSDLAVAGKSAAVKIANHLPNKLIQNTKNITTISERNNNVTEKNGVKFRWRYVVGSDGTIYKGNFPKFESKCNVMLPKEDWQASDYIQFNYCTDQLKNQIIKNKIDKSIFTDEQIEQIMNGETPSGFIWHHNEQGGLMQLVDSATHMSAGHTGGKHIWGGGTANR